jgi:hypothetical protein
MASSVHPLLFDEGFRTQKGVAAEATMAMNAKDAGQFPVI